jgi:hypothetical protein
MFIHIHGNPIDKFKNSAKIEWLNCLVWYDGPLLSQVREINSDFLFLAIDSEWNTARWLVIEYDESQYKEILTSFGQFMRTREKYWIVDIDENDLYTTYSVNRENIPEEYLPTEDSVLNSVIL